MPRGKPAVFGRHVEQELRNIPLVCAPSFPLPFSLMNSQRWAIVAVSFFLLGAASLFGNGGAWQTGVPLTGNGAASDQKKSTNVTIEDEKLTIDLHQEFAAVEVRYRMKNTGGQVDQDFFFPVERWAEGDGEDGGSALTDLEGYTIKADADDLKFENVEAKGVKLKPEKDKSWGEFKPATRLWKKSSIPFAAGQTREIVIRYQSPYAANQSSVSDDSHSAAAYFYYSLSPAATWKGPIGKGKITLNYLHPRPEEIVISKPKDRFKKITDTQFVWEFQNLKPTLADDIKIVAHPAYDNYWAHYDSTEEERKAQIRGVHVVENNKYYFQHNEYDVVASSTKKAEAAPSPTPQSSPASEELTSQPQTYDADNIRSLSSESAWAEGVDGDGVGENLTLTVRKPLPLDEILLVPGNKTGGVESWTKNNRVAELEVTLNNEHTFVAAIPDEKFVELYPIPVRGYTKPVTTVKLTIKAVHRGTETHDTFISGVELRGKLSQKPKIQGAR